MKYDTIIYMKNDNKHLFNLKKSIYIVIFSIVIGYLLCTLVHFTIHRQEETIAILGFHDVIKDEDKTQHAPYNMWVESESAFAEKMAYLYEQGYQTWTMQQLYEWKCHQREIEGKVVVLTFDDGYRSSKDIIAPILAKYGFQGTTFVIGANVQEVDDPHSAYLRLTDLQDQSIMAYHSHTYQLHDKSDHEYAMDRCDEEGLQRDFDLEQQIVDCSYVAYPYGYNNDAMINVLKKNRVKLAFGYHENKKAQRDGDFYRIPRFSVNAYTGMDTLKAMLESE